MGADSPKLPKARRAPTKLEESKPHQYQSPDELYRACYYEILDTTAESLNTRINDKANVFLVSAERLLVAAWAGTDIDDIDIEEVSKNGDIDAKHLIIQLKSLENLSKYKTAMITDILKEISSCKVMIPQVLLLCILYLVCPATTATAERSFSILRRLKTCLRGTMSQRRLNNLMILSIYKEEVDNLDMKCIVNDFIKNCDVKRTNAFSLIK